MKNLIFTFWAVCCLMGCAKTELPDIAEGESVPTMKGSILTQEMLKERAMKVPIVMAGQRHTKSSPSLEVTGINPLRQSLATRSKGIPEGPDVDNLANIYVINYGQQEGFAIMSADTRLDDVLAYSDNGSFDDAVQNLGMQQFLCNIPDYVERELASYRYLDSMDPDFEYFVNERVLIGSDQRESKEPLIPVRWSCYAPFANQLQSGNTGPTVAAMLQIMSYYGQPSSFTLINSVYPPSYENINLDWPTYRTYFFGTMMQNDSEAVNAISKLAKSIYTGVTEDKIESQSLMKAATAWPVYGYTSSQEDNYYMYGILDEIDNNRPVMVRGYSNRFFSNYWQYREPSTWIIDGYKRFFSVYANFRHWYDVNHNLKRTELVSYETVTSKCWFHCNWGWDSRGDGYFLSEVFSPSTPEQSDNLLPFDGKPGKYQYELKQLTGIRPI